MKRGKPRKGLIGLLALILVFSLFTAVVFFKKGEVNSTSFSSLHAGSLSCKDSAYSEMTLAQYFEVHQATHFYQVIQTAVRSQPGAKKRLNQTSKLLNQINQEILKPQGEIAYTQMDTWLASYPGGENFRFQQGTVRKYDLDGFFSYVEKDVHRFFYSMLKEVLLPQNLWTVSEPSVRGSAQIQSVGVRLNENTWARIGVFPKSWHLHVFKSTALESNLAESARPREHLPVQALSMRYWNQNRLEIVDGSGKTRLEAKSPDQLDLTPLCEWMAGEGRRDQQLSQRVLKNL